MLGRAWRMLARKRTEAEQEQRQQRKADRLTEALQKSEWQEARLRSLEKRNQLHRE